MAKKEKKRGRRKYKHENLEDGRRFFDKIKSIFDNFLKVLF